MKTIETKGGQIINIYETRKEFLHDAEMMVFSPEWWDTDASLYIEYKDGSHFYIGSDAEAEGKFKRNNIKAVVYSDACVAAVYGDYQIYNIDDTNEYLSEETDSEEKIWNVDVA